MISEAARRASRERVALVALTLPGASQVGVLLVPLMSKGHTDLISKSDFGTKLLINFDHKNITPQFVIMLFATDFMSDSA